MLTHYQIYNAFTLCRQIYGIDNVHVQLIAKQLDVLASDVVEYINNNSSLFTTRINKANSGYDDADNQAYGGMIVSAISAIPFINTVSVIREGDNGGIITLTITGDTFKNSTSTANWTISAGNTNLTLSAVNNGTTTKILTFTGTAQMGTLSIKCKADGMAGGVASDILYYDVPALDVSYSALENLSERVSDIEDVLPGLLVLDLSDDTVNYQLPSSAKDVVVTDNAALPLDLVLPSALVAMVGKKVSVSNQDGEDLKINPSGTDTINGTASTATTLATTESATFLCYATGAWAII